MKIQGSSDLAGRIRGLMTGEEAPEHGESSVCHKNNNMYIL